jgi:hypothetical protein
VIATVQELNADPAVDGILVQLPLPAHIDETAVLDAISQEKDADGLHPLNVGCLVLKGRTPAAISCTPWVRRGGGPRLAACGGKRRRPGHQRCRALSCGPPHQHRYLYAPRRSCRAASSC